jgi:dynein heavy chain
LEAVVDKIQRVLERVCKDVNKQAKLYQESVRDQVRCLETFELLK